MPGLTTPFDYVNILIGEEVIYRSLVEQEDFAAHGQYGAEWTEADQIEKSAAYFKSNVLRADFSIPPQYQNCVPYPPCPWSKTDHKVEISRIKPIIMGTDGVYTHSFAVHRRTDQNNTYTVGPKVIEYTNNQSALDPSIQGEFSYYQNNQLSPYLGLAIFVTQRFNRGVFDRQFVYLFELIAG